MAPVAQLNPMLVAPQFVGTDGSESGVVVTVVIEATAAGCDFSISNQAGNSFVEKMVRD